LHWRVEPVFETVERCGVAYMSRSRLEPRGDEVPAGPMPSSPRRRGSTLPDATGNDSPIEARLAPSNDEQPPLPAKPSRKRNTTRKTSEPA
jgi:hypothetical protein